MYHSRKTGVPSLFNAVRRSSLILAWRFRSSDATSRPATPRARAWIAVAARSRLGGGTERTKRRVAFGRSGLSPKRRQLQPFEMKRRGTWYSQTLTRYYTNQGDKSNLTRMNTPSPLLKDNDHPSPDALEYLSFSLDDKSGNNRLIFFSTRDKLLAYPIEGEPSTAERICCTSSFRGVRLHLTCRLGLAWPVSAGSDA